MKKIINMAVMLMIITVTAFGQTVKTKNYDIVNYNKIKVSNSIDVKLVADRQEGVSVSCDERLLPAIKIEKNDEELNIGLDWDILKKITGNRRNRSISINEHRVKINGVIFNGGIEVIVHVKQVKAITTSSFGDVEWEGSLPSKELYLKTSFSGDIQWKGVLKVDKLHITCYSSGDVEGNYTGKQAVVNLNSSGGYEGKMNVETLDADISTSGDFEGEVNAKKATFDLNSSGDANVKGVIHSLYVEASSSADFYGKKIVYKYAEIEMNSLANIYLSKSGKVVDKTLRCKSIIIR